MKKLCIVFGGASSEHDISIITAMQLRKSYESKREVEMIYLGLDNKFYLATKLLNLSDFEEKNKLKLKELIISGDVVYLKNTFLKKYCDIECVINCCHGGVGENGDLAGFFAVNGVKFTSANSLSAHITMDKNLTKQLLANIPTVNGILVKKSNFLEKCIEIEENLPNFLIVKPNSLGSSIGVKACDKSNYKDQIKAIFEMGDDALVEERVVNIIEYNQACFKDGEKFVLSAIESPLTKSEVLTFEDKYKTPNKTKGKDREIPAKLSKALEKQICENTKQIYEELNVNGVARIDYIFDKEKNKLYFNEINTVPGSMSFYLYEPVGIDYITLVDKLVENATIPTFQHYFSSDILNGKKI